MAQDGALYRYERISPMKPRRNLRFL